MNEKGRKLNNKIPEFTKTGDVITNDFDLKKSKHPTQSTLKSQFKTTEQLREQLASLDIDNRSVAFDRLWIAVNLVDYAEFIKFDDWGLIDAENPRKPATYMSAKEENMEQDEDSSVSLDIDDETEVKTGENNFPDRLVHWDYNVDLPDELPPLDESDFEEDEITKPNYRNMKCQIPYEILKEHLGLNNIFIEKGNFVIDITGKFLASENNLGSINRYNIRQALRKVLEIDIIDFDIDNFISIAKVFLCDVCVDLTLDSQEQVKKSIDGISSFFPLASDSFNIFKYKKHGLFLTSKSKSVKSSLCIYGKGEEILFSRKQNRATKYTSIIGDKGVELAKRTLRIESHLRSFKEIRKALGFESKEVLLLTEVLTMPASMIIKEFEKFSATPDKLAERISGYIENKENETVSLDDKWLTEQFVNLLIANNYDISRLKSHILTEYDKVVSEEELQECMRKANTDRNILNYIVYRKPKSVTIVLNILSKLYEYCSSNGDMNNAI